MKKQGLFRKNALLARANRLEGKVLIAQPLSTTILTICFVFLVIVTIAFLSQSSFNRKETVSGYLHPDSGISRVTAPRPGTVQAVYVHDGQFVEQGEPLILLNASEYSADGENVNFLLLNNISEQVQLLETQIKQISSRAQFQENELKQRIIYHSTQLEDLQEQNDLAQERLTLNQRRLIDLQLLNENGLLATEELRQQEEVILGLRQQLAELRGSIQMHRSQSEQMVGELSRLPGDSEQEISGIEYEISRLRQQQLELNARGDFLITAPISGVVTNLFVDQGFQVQQSSNLVTLVPEDSDLRAILVVPTRAYGFIQEGQSTRIRFDAFPYQRFGLFEGEISGTSKSILIPNEVYMPVDIQEPFYRVEATLATQKIRAYGDSVPLQAGMLLSADVVLEKRSLLSWLLEPLLSLQGQL